MKKSKRKPAVAIKRPQNPLDAPVPSHTNQGGLLVLGLKSALGTLDGSISHIPSADLPPSPAVIPSSGAGTSTAREANGSPVDNTNASLDGFLVEDCSDEEDLEEEQLDFSCSEEEYERSPPSSLTPVTQSYHLLRLRSPQSYLQALKEPSLTRSTMLKQVNLSLLPLVVVDGKICSFPTTTSPLT